MGAGHFGGLNSARCFLGVPPSGLLFYLVKEPRLIAMEGRCMPDATIRACADDIGAIIDCLLGDRGGEGALAELFKDTDVCASLLLYPL